MSEIRKGDLVMVVRNPTCGCSTAMGRVFQVHELRVNETFPYCYYCGKKRPITLSAHLSDGKWIELSRLIKIDPPATGDEVSTRVPRDEDIRLTEKM